MNMEIIEQPSLFFDNTESTKLLGAICRICLLSNNLLPVIPLEVANIFEKITNIAFRMNEEFPGNICEDCNRQLNEVHQFIEKCKNNHNLLILKLEQYQTDEIPDSSWCGNEDFSVETKNKVMKNPENIPDKPKLENRMEKKFECAKCDAGFTLKLSLVNHLKKHAQDEKYLRTGIRNFHRPLSTRHKAALYNVKRYKSDGREATRTSVSRTNIEHGLELKSIKSKYYCSQCNRVLTSRSALSSHMKTHTGERPYSCLYCGKTFSYISSLTVHTRLHTGETPYVCSICNKGYRSSTSLKKHKEVKHYDIEDSMEDISGVDGKTNETKSKESSKQECNICHKVLDKYGFGTHMRIHTVEKKQFICEFCNKQFQKNSHLERHIRIHTGNPTRKKSSGVKSGDRKAKKFKKKDFF